MMLKIIQVELKKCICSLIFLGSILLITVLCFTATVYTDPSVGRTYTAFEALFQLSDTIKQQELSLSAIQVFSNGLNGNYATLFVPIAVGLSYVPLYCNECQSGGIRIQLIRTKKWHYSIAKYISAMISGGLTLLFGYLIFGAIVFQTFPKFNIELAECQGLQLPDTTIIYYIKLCAGKFLYGMVSIWPSFLLCAFLRQVHLIICIPVLFCFLQNTVLDLMSFSYHTLVQILLWTIPNRVSLLFYQFSWQGLLITLCGPILSFIVFSFCLYRRNDCGT